jgi:hypothetical protein
LPQFLKQSSIFAVEVSQVSAGGVCHWCPADGFRAKLAGVTPLDFRKNLVDDGVPPLL